MRRSAEPPVNCARSSAVDLPFDDRASSTSTFAKPRNNRLFESNALACVIEAKAQWRKAAGRADGVDAAPESPFAL